MSSAVLVHTSRSRPLLLVLGAAIALGSFLIGHARTASVRQSFVARPTLRGAYRDGTYSAWGTSRHGRILARLVIRRGRIVSVDIVTCRMRYPCSMIAALPAQAVERQSGDVDLVSGATQSSEALSRAITDALTQAVRP